MVREIKSSGTAYLLWLFALIGLCGMVDKTNADSPPSSPS
jgi:hypothetical protein